jgi:hypothetical protein
MPVTILIPTPLRRFVGGAKNVAVAADAPVSFAAGEG